jgi:hypothetical protein
MDIKQDPNSIPNFNSSGRIGEAQQHEPEQAQSSVQLDSTADGDGAASGEADVHESLLDDGTGKPAKPRRSAADGEDPSTTGAGAIDGLVGAP